MSSNLAKPGTVSAVLIQRALPASKGFGDAGSTGDTPANDIILIKTEAVQFTTSVQVIETTGDGDSKSRYDHGAMLRIRFQISGYAIADNVIGLASLEDNTDPATTANAANGEWLMKFNYHGSTRSIVGKAMIEGIQISYSKKSPVVALSMSGYLSIDDKASSPEPLETPNSGS